ncbi:uncharacterized protein LOC130808310 [Amaranthus tricolor]|uniref:uncharacterized protein LOC130808310 n=1 Tax=Amaranthus tricolor TaxID=29722 RepID=UPI00258BD5B4|nr:uncharacterized protein LOC130808310 [Amaranthus tricolor]
MGQLLQLINQLNCNKLSTENTNTLSISEKLTNQNYTKWSRLMHLAISRRGRLNHIIDDPPSKNDPAYNQWTRSDSIVISWILENIDSDLVNQYLDFPIAKALWQGIETLYSSGRDGLQIFDLTVKINKTQQGTNTIETYYSKPLMLWKEIDRRQPNPMKDPGDIIIYNQLTQQNRLYQFLAGINESFDKERRDLLLLDPLPIVEEANASIRREVIRRHIMKTEPSSDLESPGSGGVFSARGRTYRRDDDKTHLKCTHCGGTRHTKNECFKLVGYPEWWPDTKKKGEKKPARYFDQHLTGRAAVGWSIEEPPSMEERENQGGAMQVTCIRDGKGNNTRKEEEGNDAPPQKQETGLGLRRVGSEDKGPQPFIKRGGSRASHATLPPNQFSTSFNTLSYLEGNWIFDCGATDTMSYDPKDFLTRDKPMKDIIKTANGEVIKVSGVGRLKTEFKCETCILAKSHKHSYSSSLNKADMPLMLVHSDVWGPAPVVGLHGFSYFVTFIDDCTRMSWIYFLKQKSEVFHVFVEFYNMICTQFQTQPRMFRTDNGREYINSNMQQFFKQQGLIHQTSCPNTPQQNGVAERKNRTLLEMTRAIMLDSHVPTHLWPKAIATANYLTNRLPTKSLQYHTPLVTLQTHISIPSSHTLPPRIFGCTVFVHCPARVRNKFEPRAVKCVFIGYGRNQKGYRCYDPSTRKVYTTMDYEFIETEYYYPHLRRQGEKYHDDDDLSWLISLWLPNLDPKDQVDNATESPHQDVLSTPLPLPILSDHQVSHTVLDNVVSASTNSNTNSDNVLVDTLTEEVATDTVETRGHDASYMLPPRSTRGVPPIQEGNLSQSALAFKVTLDTTKSPTTVEEALMSAH